MPRPNGCMLSCFTSEQEETLILHFVLMEWRAAAAWLEAACRAPSTRGAPRPHSPPPLAFCTYDVIAEEDEGAPPNNLSVAHSGSGRWGRVLLLSRRRGAERLPAGQAASSRRSKRCSDIDSGAAASELTFITLKGITLRLF